MPFLKRYRVAAGSARALRDYLLMHDSSFLHDYRLPRDPSYYTITVTSTETRQKAAFCPVSRYVRQGMAATREQNGVLPTVE